MNDEALAARFRTELARFHGVQENEIELTLVDGLVAVPGFVAISGETPKGITRGWVRKDDGLVVIIRHADLTPIVHALRLADEPPPYDDEQVAEILTWGYGVQYTLLHEVKKGELGIKYALSAPPMREVRKKDGATIFRWLVRIERESGPLIMHYQIELLRDGTDNYNGWQLAPKDADDLDQEDE